MMDQKFDREFEALIADQRVGLKAADLVLREHRIEVIGAGREYRLSNALLLEHQGRKRERPGRRQQLLYITVEGGFAGAQRVGTMREMPALVDRLAKGQHVAAAQAMERPLSWAGDRRHVPRDTVAAPCERNLEQALADWLRQPSGRADRKSTRLNSSH